MDLHKRGLWRMLDANFNRCGEGLRVVEDWVRFVLNHSELARSLKGLRHELHQLGESWPLETRLSARDAAEDVGRQIQTPTEYQREESRDLVQANFYRVSQGLRVLEEVSKALDLGSAEQLEQMRYRVYERQSEILLLDWQPVAPRPTTVLALGNQQPQTDYSLALGNSGEKSAAQRWGLLQQATLYVLVDGGSSFADYQRHVQALVQAGVDVIQLRDKSLTDQELWKYARWTAKLLGPTATLFIVNDRCDVAVAAGADGVHLGQEELPVSVARELLGEQRLIGLSTHNPNQVREAHSTSANYLGLGPVFPSKTKTFNEWIGLAALAECRPLIGRPTFVIGGIDIDNQATIRQAGFPRVAVQNALGPEQDIPRAVEQLRATGTLPGCSTLP